LTEAVIWPAAFATKKLGVKPGIREALFSSTASMEHNFTKSE